MQILLKELLKEVDMGGLPPAQSPSAPEPDSQPESPQSTQKKKIQIYCDMDGVLVDLDKGFAAHPMTGGYTVNNFKNHPKFGGQEKLARKTFWKIIDNTPNFWLNLPEMPDAKNLWKFISENFSEPAPVLLTAGQNRSTDPQFSIKEQKEAWIRKHISASAKVMLSDAGRNKSQHAINRTDPSIIHLLIDDTEKEDPKNKNCTNWEAAGDNFKALHYIGLADAKTKLSEFMVANGYPKPNLSQ